MSGILTGTENSAARVGGDVATIGVEIKDGALKAGGAVWGARSG